MEGVREGRGYVSVEFRGRGGRYWSGKGRELTLKNGKEWWERDA